MTQRNAIRLLLRYDYNEHGCRTGIEDNDIEVSLAYDTFGRFTKQQATDKKTGAILSTTLTYDDLNREIKREISTSGQSALVIEQTYQRNYLLKERIT